MGQILSAPITEKHSEQGQDKYLVYALSCMQGWRMSMEDAHATVLNLNTYKPTNGSSIKFNSSNNDNEDEDEQDGEDETQIDDEPPSTIHSNSNSISNTTDSNQINNNNNTNTNNNDDDEHIAFFGVYDGHGGEKAAIFAGENLHQIIKETEAYGEKDYINALKHGFLNCDQSILKDFRFDDDSGCAATSVIITPNTIYCGNAGDSRTIMSINGFAKALSFDHKPSNEGEKARIRNAGGFVDMGRVNGNLALSRGIADFEFKKNIDLPAEEQIVTALPDVLSHNINYDTDEFLILACDGIWDCLSSQRAVECVRRGIYERKSLTQICEEIMELCCAPTSDGSGIGCDNMSISIVVLLDYKNNETLDQWYDKVISRIEKLENNDNNINNHNLTFKYGPISPPYEQIYKEMYGEIYEIGQHGSNQNGNNRGNLGGQNIGQPFSISNNIFGTRSSFHSIDDDSLHDDDDEDEDELSGRVPPSLQKLIASNAITNENGVIYLDTNSAQSILQHFGMAEESPSTTTTSIEEEDEEDEDEDDEDDDVHQKHIEEEEDDEDDEDDDEDLE
ncbi:phosphatase 2C-like domain-containing protein [Scheffersomyces amazonensis]|uniref:phosphatase 2C-like domain-containing protein n=1 Tax=Scheffersomyces amazonensis TaxID=1078765 RepID=UPI00315D5E1F